jgi:hypothetical protein
MSRFTPPLIDMLEIEKAYKRLTSLGTVGWCAMFCVSFILPVLNFAPGVESWRITPYLAALTVVFFVAGPLAFFADIIGCSLLGKIPRRFVRQNPAAWKTGVPGGMLGVCDPTWLRFF